MRPIKQRDYSPEIKKILADNPKTFEFFALCLTVMTDLSQDDRNIIAKSAATNGANAYYPAVKNDNDKKFKRAFKETIFQTLTQDFDNDKAASFVNTYTKTRKFNLKALNTQRGRPLTTQSIFGKFTFRDTQLVIEENEFVKILNISTDYHFPQNHLEFQRVFKLLASDDAKFRSWPMVLAYMTGILLNTTVVSLTLYHLGSLAISLVTNGSFQADLAFMLLFDAMAIFITITAAIPAIFNFLCKQGAKQADQLQHELIASIESSLKQVAPVEKPIHQPNPTETATTPEPTYHFSLFTLATINPPSNTQSTQRSQPKLKTRPAFVTPAQGAQQPREDNQSIDTYYHHNITFHRIFNRHKKPTQDFIGLDINAAELPENVFNKVKSLLNDPTLVNKKAKSGIVNIKDEKAKKKMKAHKYGMFKIKDKGADERIYTHEATEIIKLKNEEITLHTANIIKKH